MQEATPTDLQSTPPDFWEWAVSLQPAEQVAILIVGAFILVFVITMITGTIYKMHRNRLEHTLKRELLDRRMSADEIATIMRSKPNQGLNRGAPNK